MPKTNELDFQPLPLFSCPHVQTIAGALIRLELKPASETIIIDLADGDQVTCEITTPVNWKETDVTVFFVHGLCGCHDSAYLVRMVNRLEPLGIRCIRFNMRGFGSGKGLSKGICHSGRSEDILDALKIIHSTTPNSPIILVGFSFGGSISLKLVGEISHSAGKYLKGMISVCPPADIERSVDRASHALNGFYQNHFCNLYKKYVAELHEKFGLDPFVFPENLTFRDFDKLYKAPKAGFKSVEEYYEICSAKRYVSDISIPCRIIFSEDDPIIPPDCLEGVSIPSNVEIYSSKLGGHMGFLGDVRHPRGLRWLDSLLVDWIKELSA